MSKVKAGGTAKNQRDSNPKYRGVKHPDGSKVKIGMIIVRQNGTRILAGKNIGVARDHTLFALKDGTVRFKEVYKKGFNGKGERRKMAHIIPSSVPTS